MATLENIKVPPLRSPFLFHDVVLDKAHYQILFYICREGVFEAMPSLPLISLFIMTLLYATWAQQESCFKECQELINTYEKEMDFYWNVYKEPPNLNNKDYIRKMASFISEGFSRKVLVAGGPKYRDTVFITNCC